jgi:mono/diheme cytochrome c family protein
MMLHEERCGDRELLYGGSHPTHTGARLAPARTAIEEGALTEGKSSKGRRHFGVSTAILLALVLLAVSCGLFVYSGIYDIGADAPHWPVVYGLLDDIRDHSIAHHARHVTAPSNLEDPKRIAVGAGLYQEMCTSCHLGPGIEKTEISQGLYPAAPELARGDDLSPAEQFWTIKHGVKLTAMPAWGKTHEDELIWDLVAFIRQLPKMTPDQYKKAVASAPADHDEMMKTMDKPDAH